MDARSTNRRLLIAAAAVGVLAGIVGIGASIVGTEDERSESDQASNEDERSESDQTSNEDATTPVPPLAEEQPPAPAEEEEPTEAEEAAIEARLEAEAAISRAQAEQIAQGQVAGPVERARISDETGTPVWEVRIEGPDGNVDVLVDATTGQVLEVDD